MAGPVAADPPSIDTTETTEVFWACVDPFFGELPLGKTVWYTVEGTGEEMTVDTTGSGFDTVAGVYVVALTFETMPDTTYYVQIGGFDGQYGHLKVALR
jgi:hypothetical protein